MKKRSRFARLAAAGVAVFAAVIALITPPVRSQTAPGSLNPSGLMVIQGHVTGVDKDSITIRTPEIRPTPEPGKMTPMFIIAGSTFKADISQARYDSPIGLPNGPKDLKVGDPIVLVCAPNAMTSATSTVWWVTAYVVEKLQIPLAP